MMLNPIILGLVAAIAVFVPFQLATWIEIQFQSVVLSAPVFLLAATGVAMLFQRFILERRSGPRGYDGLADLFIHIHSVGSPDSALRWFARGLNSFLLALFGGTVGAEGAATEFAHALAIKTRTRSAHRFEQRRRTDASVALSAGISAAFGAPFAGIMVPFELGVGGPVRPAVVAALSAFVFTRFANTILASSGFVNLGGALNAFHFGWREALGLLAVVLCCSLSAVLLIHFLRYVQDNLRDLFQVQAWMRILTAGVLLFFVAVIYKSGHALPSLLLEKVLWGRLPSRELGLLLLTQVLTLALVLGGFGTIGIFWPLFVLGSVCGVAVDHFILNDIAGLAAAAGLTGAAVFWGAVFGTPLSAALVAWELTGSAQALVIGGVAAGLGTGIARFLKTQPLVEKNLEARGVSLVDGRSSSILDSIFVRDAMVADFETVHEHEPISEIHARLLKSRYPFLPVTTSLGGYKGLLTVDMVQDAWEAHEQASVKSPGSPLIKLLEAKDLLYRSGVSMTTIRAAERLSKTAGIFDDSPCVPVLTEDGRVVGLLFVYNVRLAYDREVARRSLLIENREV